MRIEIAPNFSCDDWAKLKSRLPVDGALGTAAAEWEKAANVVRDRIHVRFFRPAEALDSLKHAGFAVLAIDCLLLEALQAFRSGSKGTREQGVTLLRTSRHFAELFSQHDLASRFFSQVRNGLLHDGETRGGWIVKASPHYELLQCCPDGFVVVNRKKFHQALVAEFGDYLDSLTGTGNEARRNLVKALDGLCKRSQPTGNCKGLR